MHPSAHILTHRAVCTPPHQTIGIFADRVKLVQRESGEYHERHPVECFATSIWDETLYKAWSKIVHTLIPNMVRPYVRCVRVCVHPCMRAQSTLPRQHKVREFGAVQSDRGTTRQPRQHSTAHHSTSVLLVVRLILVRTIAFRQFGPCGRSARAQTPITSYVVCLLYTSPSPRDRG